MGSVYDGMLERLRCPVTAERVDSRRAPPERAPIVQLLVHGGVELHRGTLVLHSRVPVAGIRLVPGARAVETH